MAKRKIKRRMTKVGTRANQARPAGPRRAFWEVTRAPRSQRPSPRSWTGEEAPVESAHILGHQGGNSLSHLLRSSKEVAKSLKEKAQLVGDGAVVAGPILVGSKSLQKRQAEVQEEKEAAKAAKRLRMELRTRGHKEVPRKGRDPQLDAREKGRGPEPHVPHCRLYPADAAKPRHRRAPEDRYQGRRPPVQRRCQGAEAAAGGGDVRQGKDILRTRCRAGLLTDSSAAGGLALWGSAERVLLLLARRATRPS